MNTLMSGCGNSKPILYCIVLPTSPLPFHLFFLSLVPFPLVVCRFINFLRSSSSVPEHLTSRWPLRERAVERGVRKPYATKEVDCRVNTGALFTSVETSWPVTTDRTETNVSQSFIAIECFIYLLKPKTSSQYKVPRVSLVTTSWS